MFAKRFENYVDSTRSFPLDPYLSSPHCLTAAESDMAYQKLVMFSGGIERNHWHEMSEVRSGNDVTIFISQVIFLSMSID